MSVAITSVVRKEVNALIKKTFNIPLKGDEYSPFSFSIKEPSYDSPAGEGFVLVFKSNQDLANAIFCKKGNLKNFMDEVEAICEKHGVGMGVGSIIIDPKELQARGKLECAKPANKEKSIDVEGRSTSDDLATKNNEMAKIIGQIRKDDLVTKKKNRPIVQGYFDHLKSLIDKKTIPKDMVLLEQTRDLLDAITQKYSGAIYDQAGYLINTFEDEMRPVRKTEMKRKTMKQPREQDRLTGIMLLRDLRRIDPKDVILLKRAEHQQKVDTDTDEKKEEKEETFQTPIGPVQVKKQGPNSAAIAGAKAAELIEAFVKKLKNDDVRLKHTEGNRIPSIWFNNIKIEAFVKKDGDEWVYNVAIQYNLALSKFDWVDARITGLKLEELESTLQSILIANSNLDHYIQLGSKIDRELIAQMLQDRFITEVANVMFTGGVFAFTFEISDDMKEHSDMRYELKITDPSVEKEFDDQNLFNEYLKDWEGWHVHSTTGVYYVAHNDNFKGKSLGYDRSIKPAKKEERGVRWWAKKIVEDYMKHPGDIILLLEKAVNDLGLDMRVVKDRYVTSNKYLWIDPGYVEYILTGIFPVVELEKSAEPATIKQAEQQIQEVIMMQEFEGSKGDAASIGDSEKLKDILKGNWGDVQLANIKTDFEGFPGFLEHFSKGTEGMIPHDYRYFNKIAKDVQVEDGFIYAEGVHFPFLVSIKQGSDTYVVAITSSFRYKEPVVKFSKNQSKEQGFPAKIKATFKELAEKLKNDIEKTGGHVVAYQYESTAPRFIALQGLVKALSMSYMKEPEMDVMEVVKIISDPSSIQKALGADVNARLDSNNPYRYVPYYADKEKNRLIMLKIYLNEPSKANEDQYQFTFDFVNKEISHSTDAAQSSVAMLKETKAEGQKAQTGCPVWSNRFMRAKLLCKHAVNVLVKSKLGEFLGPKRFNQFLFDIQNKKYAYSDDDLLKEHEASIEAGNLEELETMLESKGASSDKVFNDKKNALAEVVLNVVFTGTEQFSLGDLMKSSHFKNNPVLKDLDKQEIQNLLDTLVAERTLATKDGMYQMAE